MLGKASEIKTTLVYDRETNFDFLMKRWRNDNPNADVIDIKFSTHYDNGDENTWVNALIIYKEDTQHAQP